MMNLNLFKKVYILKIISFVLEEMGEASKLLIKEKANNLIY